VEFIENNVSQHALKTLTISNFISLMNIAENALSKTNPVIGSRFVGLRQKNELQFFHNPQAFVDELLCLLKELDSGALLGFLAEFIMQQDSQRLKLILYKNLL